MYIIIKKALGSSNRQSFTVQFWEAQMNLQAIATKVWCWNHFVKYSYRVSERQHCGWLFIYSTFSSMHIYTLICMYPWLFLFSGLDLWPNSLYYCIIQTASESTYSPQPCKNNVRSGQLVVTDEWPALEHITLKAQVHPSHCGIGKLKLLTAHKRKERATADHVGCPQSMQLKWVTPFSCMW